MAEWIRKIIKKLFKFSSLEIMNCGKLVRTAMGIPQGDSLSPLLFVLAIIQLYRFRKQSFAPYITESKLETTCVAYIDDIKIYTREMPTRESFEKFTNLAKNMGLSCNINKCGIVVKNGILENLWPIPEITNQGSSIQEFMNTYLKLTVSLGKEFNQISESS